MKPFTQEEIKKAIKALQVTVNSCRELSLESTTAEKQRYFLDQSKIYQTRISELEAMLVETKLEEVLKEA